MTLADLNAESQDAFVAALGGVVEDAPWVAARAWERAALRIGRRTPSRMMEALSAAGGDAQLAVLRAHPDLGARARMATRRWANRPAPGSTG